MKKLLIVLAIMAAGIFTAKAQVFEPSLYLQLQGGAGFDHGDAPATDLISPAAQVALGYQFSDAWALRAAVTGWQAKNASPASATLYGFKFVQPMLDLVLDLGTAFAGWNPDRVFNPYIYLGAGTAIGLENEDAIALAKAELFPRLWEPTKFMWATRSGLGTDIRLAKRLSLNLEFNGNIYPETFDSKLNKEFESGGDWRFNLFAGLKFHFGLGKKAPKAAPVYVPTRPTETYERSTKPTQVIPERYEEEPVFEGPAIFQGADVDIFFDLNKSVIRTDQLSTMNRLVSYMRNNADVKVKLDGYADRGTGNPEINQELSEQRVAAVRQYLVSRGIEASRITVEAHGDTVQPFSGEKNRVVTCKVR